MKIKPSVYLLFFPFMLILLAFPFVVKGPIYLDMFITFCIMAGLGCSWNIIGGYGGQFSIGHGAFFGIGAYTSTLLYLKLGVSPWIGMICGGTLASLISLAIFWPCFRLRGIFFTMASLAFAEIVMVVSVYWQGLTNGNVGLLILYDPKLVNLIFESKTGYAYTALIYMLVVFGLCLLIERAKLGSHLTAVREDEEAAESLGVKSTRYKAYAMMTSAFFTAVGGTIFAQYTQFIDPDTLFDVALSVRFALLAIIGGIATAIGPIVGSLIMTPLDTLLRGSLGGHFAGLGLFVYGVFLILFVLILPEGVMKWVKEKIFPMMDKLPELTLFPAKSGSTAMSLVSSDTISEEERRATPLLELDDISKHFGGLSALSEVSMTINEGEIIGLIGPNGAGKTTLFNVIDGYYQPDQGTIRFAGEDTTRLSPPHKICARGIGRTFQIVKPFKNINVFENVLVGAWQAHSSPSAAKARTREILQFVDLERCSDLPGSGLTISDRKRLELARALATNPKLLLLDEVMAGLNPTEIQDIIGLIKRISSDMGITLLIIEHNMKAIMALSERIVVLDYGAKIAEGPPEEIVRDEAVIKAYLGEEYLQHVASA